MAKATTQEAGFTLIELSLVLAIIGLIVGGILVGQTLIRNSEIQSVIRDVDKYKTAMTTFRLKYNCIAGDCANATQFWPEVSPGCTDQAGIGTQTCNGNGDGWVGYHSFYEGYRVWQQLSNALLIAGTYTGVSGPINSPYDHLPGVNTPEFRIARTGIAAVSFGIFSAGQLTWMFGGNFTNVFTVGRSDQHWPYDDNSGPFYPSESYVIDSKVDDGKPGTGRVMTRPDDPGAGTPECVIGDSSSHATAVYRTNNSNPRCFLYFLNAY